MPEIRIDRISSGRRLLVMLSKEGDKIDTKDSKLLKKVAIDTEITNCVFTVPKPVAGSPKKSLEKVCVIAVDNL